MGGKAVVILFLIVVVGIGLFIVRSGIVGQAVSGITSLTNLRPASTTAPGFGVPLSIFGASKFVPAPPPAPGNVAPSLPPPAGGSQQPTSTISQSEIPTGYTLRDLSPYFHKIRIGSVSPGSIYSYGQTSLAAGFSGNETIDVSGWLLRARQGSQYVPQGINIYDPSGLTVESDIHLGSGDMLTIYTSQSAIGKNLRLNKCIGYLENTNHFTPPLFSVCPYPNRSEIDTFTGQCQNYVFSLGGCRMPDANPPVPENDYACRAYIDTLNYKGCFDKYRSDADFLSREWYAWTGSRFLDQFHDKVVLLDRNGLVVDAYEY